MTDFYRAQKIMSMNNHQFLQENCVRKYFKILQQKNAKLKKKQFINKNRNTMLNEYNENEFENVCHEL